MKKFINEIQKQFTEMIKTGKLFRAAISGHELWVEYLNAFEGNTNPVFRDPESSAHNCNHCNNFIKRYGNVVAIDPEGYIINIFSGINVKAPYKVVADTLNTIISSKKIVDVFIETYDSLNNLPYEKCNKIQSAYRLGIDKNHKQYTKVEAETFGVVKEGEVREFNHFHLDLPKQFVDQSGKSIEALIAGYRDKYSVFKRAMEEISLDTLMLVTDLINQGSLLDGTSHLHSIKEVMDFKHNYPDNGILGVNLDNWLWNVIYSMEERTAKFKNTLIGVLCSELTEGEELNKACQNWNKRVDPVNYHKATAPITKKQIAEAEKFVEENDYTESFNRRLAIMDDIKASEIKHINTGNGEIKSISVFDNVKSTSTQYKRAKFDNVEEISIDKFMKDILPSCSSVEAYLKNNHEGNLVTLTTSKEKEVKSIFKWNNPYSWNFNGNLAGKSQIKEAVKGRGGNVDGILNIRLAFPDTTSDYDIHVFEPNGGHIYYNNVRQCHNSSGMLDLDAQGVDGHQPPEKRVENVIYTDINKMSEGDYKVYVNDYSGTRFPAKFIVEIEIDSDIITLQLAIKPSSNNVDVCKIKLNKGNFEIHPFGGMGLISSNTVSKELWGLETNNFHKVNLICLSPNHWDENKVGNKHYMFMLNKCKTSTDVRGFHNENLLPNLLKHRKVMEVLGASTMVKPEGKQLSGLGFNATVRDELIVKCSGNFKRMLKIKF